MNITVLFWLGFILIILGILSWSNLFYFRTKHMAEIIGKGLTITGGCLAGLMLFARMMIWLATVGG